jgi:hypothetical protein
MNNNTNTLGTSPDWEGLRHSRRWRSTVQRICNAVRQDASIEGRNNPLALLHDRFLGCDPSQECWGVGVEVAVMVRIGERLPAQLVQAGVELWRHASEDTLRLLQATMELFGPAPTLQVAGASAVGLPPDAMFQTFEGMGLKEELLRGAPARLRL